MVFVKKRTWAVGQGNNRGHIKVKRCVQIYTNTSKFNDIGQGHIEVKD